MSKGDPVTPGMHIGIDFGARTAGNTVVCERRGSLFRFHRCAKDEDGDTWLRACVEELRPNSIYIDAPLSLPDAYFGRGTDHFFRMADRQSKGMSPMFLGGLTARAIALSKEWRKLGIAVHEAYPAALIRQEWDMLKVISGRTIPKHKLRIMAGMVQLPPPDPADRHEADAWLCWVIGERHRSGRATIFGREEEGLIIA